MRPSSVPRWVRRGLPEHRPVVRQLNRWFHRLWDRLGRSGVEYFEEDWDNLLLLGACRYDAFAEQAELPGHLVSRRSNASATREFLSVYLDGADLRDTVYVTADPHLDQHRDEVDVAFHETVDVWRDDGSDVASGGVYPETVARAAERAAERYPDKRLLVQFVKPHLPPVCDPGQRRHELASLEVVDGAIRDVDDLDDELLWRGYRENLDIVLASVRRLLIVLSGRTVVTADHGQMMGERAFPLPMREYGHPSGIRSTPLNRVPWFVHDAGSRRAIALEHTGPGSREDGGGPADRLRQLGDG